MDAGDDSRSPTIRSDDDDDDDDDEEEEEDDGGGGGRGEETGREKVKVKIRSSTGSEFTVKTKLGSSVLFFRAIVARECDVPTAQQRLIFKGRVLKDDRTLQSYGLQANDTIYLVHQLMRSSASTTDATATAKMATGDEAVVKLIPEVVKKLSMSNPRMHALIDLFPEFAHMPHDQSCVQEALKFSRYLGMARIFERFRRNFGSIPDVSSVLRRVHERLRERERVHAARSLNSKPSTTGSDRGGPNTDPLPNTWIKTDAAADICSEEKMRNTSAVRGAGYETSIKQSEVPPEELYATQLSKLQEMGFHSREDSIEALVATSGDFAAAVERLLKRADP